MPSPGTRAAAAVALAAALRAGAASTRSALDVGAARESGDPLPASWCAVFGCGDGGPGYTGECVASQHPEGWRCVCSRGYAPAAPAAAAGRRARCVATCRLLQQPDDCPHPTDAPCGGAPRADGCDRERCCDAAAAGPPPAGGGGGGDGGGWVPLRPISYALRWEWLRDWGETAVVAAVADAAGLRPGAVRIRGVALCSPEYHLCVDRHWEARGAGLQTAGASAPEPATSRGSYLRIVFEARGAHAGAADRALDACLAAGRGEGAGRCAGIVAVHHACARGAAADAHGTTGTEKAADGARRKAGVCTEYWGDRWRDAEVMEGAVEGGAGPDGKAAVMAGLAVLATVVACAAGVGFILCYWRRKEAEPGETPRRVRGSAHPSQTPYDPGSPAGDTLIPSMTTVPLSPQDQISFGVACTATTSPSQSPETDSPSAEPERHEVVDFTVQRKVCEKLGCRWVNHTVLDGVTDASPAQKQGLGAYIGWRCSHINARPITTLGDIRLAVQGVTRICLTLVNDQHTVAEQNPDAEALMVSMELSCHRPPVYQRPTGGGAVAAARAASGAVAAATWRMPSPGHLALDEDGVRHLTAPAGGGPSSPPVGGSGLGHAFTRVCRKAAGSTFGAAPLSPLASGTPIQRVETVDTFAGTVATGAATFRSCQNTPAGSPTGDPVERGPPGAQRCSTAGAAASPPSASA